jgi:hypothetical protein
MQPAFELSSKTMSPTVFQMSGDRFLIWFSERVRASDVALSRGESANQCS